VCSRCKFEKRQCTYTKSRRGGKRRIDLPDVADESVPQLHSSISSQSTPPNSHLNPPFSAHVVDHISIIDTLLENRLDARSQNQGQVEPEKLLDLYYENFHDAHPYILPRAQLKIHLETNPHSLRFLIPVLEYVGSVYLADGSSDILRQVAHAALIDGTLPYDGFSVQALLIFALAVHCCDEYDIGDSVLDKATDIALSIEMLRRPFAQANSGSDHVLEESWRRTAWSLFITDTLFAAIAHRSTHKLQTVEIDLDLPCDDLEYETGVSSRFPCILYI
jgi:hypothetical protein